MNKSTVVKINYNNVYCRRCGLTVRRCTTDEFCVDKIACVYSKIEDASKEMRKLVDDAVNSGADIIDSFYDSDECIKRWQRFNGELMFYQAMMTQLKHKAMADEQYANGR